MSNVNVNVNEIIKRVKRMRTMSQEEKDNLVFGIEFAIDNGLTDDLPAEDIWFYHRFIDERKGLVKCSNMSIHTNRGKVKVDIMYADESTCIKDGYKYMFTDSRFGDFYYSLYEGDNSKNKTKYSYALANLSKSMQKVEGMKNLKDIV